jgi:hypothetical protein
MHIEHFVIGYLRSHESGSNHSSRMCPYLAIMRSDSRTSHSYGWSTDRTDTELLVFERHDMLDVASRNGCNDPSPKRKRLKSVTICLTLCLYCSHSAVISHRLHRCKESVESEEGVLGWQRSWWSTIIVAGGIVEKITSSRAGGKEYPKDKQ